MTLTSTASERRTFHDPSSGVKITQLTDHHAHSHHIYFTNAGWWDDGRRMVFGSDRHNASNLYSIDLADGTITQLTYFAPGDDDGVHINKIQEASLNPTRPEAYLWRGQALYAVELTTGELRKLCEIEPGWLTNMTNCTADGRYVCTAASKDPFADRSGGMNFSYTGFGEMHAAHPHSRVMRVDVDTGEVDILHEENYWIGHVNTSPTRANLLTFCHEGPWHEVDQRIWGLDTQTGKVWAIRPEESGDAIGHEYWMADGEHIGYHGFHAAWADGQAVYGQIRFDNSDRVEKRFPFESCHYHSLSLDLIVGDGPWLLNHTNPLVMLWRYRDGQFEGPRVLCEHRSSMHVQKSHVHPRFTPDGEAVLFTSDASGYANLYLADLPAFDDLKPLN